MQTDQILRELLWNPTELASLPSLVLRLIIAAVLGILLGQAYVYFGQSLSNRKIFARNFIVLTVTTTLIISIVRSSVALSLGLVGALSIVRFRAAIKEPEELAFLFLAISAGLGLGAGAVGASQILAAFATVGASATLKRFDQTPDQVEAAFLVDFKDVDKLEQFNNRIRELSPQVRISCLDDRGFGA
jgi:ABC-type spermidine/putrescine transport system permease subunit II